MNKKRYITLFFALFVCVSLVAVLLAGCSKESNDETDETKKSKTTTDVVAESNTDDTAITKGDVNTEEITEGERGSESDTEIENNTELEAQTGVDILHEGFGDNKNYVVVIDAGHQRHGIKEQEPIGPGSETMKDKVTSGTQGSFTGVPEYELTLAVALQLRDTLIERGYTVVMVRETHDVEVSNIERAEIANKYAPSEENGYVATINLRIHANGFTNPDANGALMCCPTKDNPYKIGEIFEECERLANAIIDPYCKETGMRKRPSHIQYGDNMTGTNWCEIPTTILEMGFMTNEADDKLMQTTEFKENAAKGIADGIENYFKPAK